MLQRAAKLLGIAVEGDRHQRHAAERKAGRPCANHAGYRANEVSALATALALGASYCSVSAMPAPVEAIAESSPAIGSSPGVVSSNHRFLGLGRWVQRRVGMQHPAGQCLLVKPVQSPDARVEQLVDAVGTADTQRYTVPSSVLSGPWRASNTPITGPPGHCR